MKPISFFIAMLSLLGVLSTCRAQSDTQSGASSQFESRPSLGVIGGASLNEFRTTFRYLPGVPACSPVYQSGHGFGGNVGAAFNLPLSARFGFMLRGAYAMDGGLLTVDEPTTISVAGIATSATIEHTIQTKLGLIDVEPSVSYQLFFQLRLFAGVGVGYLLATSFDQKESLTQPTDVGVFTNGSRTRNEQTGALPNAAKLITSVMGGVNFLLPLNASKTLSAIPELSWSQWLTSPVKELAWNVGGLRGSVAIMYTIPEAAAPPVAPPPVAPPPVAPPPVAPPPVAPLQPKPPVEPKKPELLASITVRGVDADGSESPVATLKVEEIYETHLAPLVPYVFFDENSSAISNRYRSFEASRADTFALKSLNGSDRLTMYHDILNILGKRLQEHSTAHVTLTGCTALGTDNGGRSLSKARAETVKTYLSDVWHVAPNRIQVASRELPQNYSPRSDSDGMAENRRVEIASNDASILAPLSLSDTLRLTTPPIVRFYPEAVSEAGVASWRIEALQDGSKLYSSSGTRLPKMLDWNLNNDQQHIPKAPGKLDISFTVVDSANTTRFASDTLSILQLTLRAKKRELAGDAEIQHYSLLLFDFKSSELSLRDQEVLKFIKSHISEHSVVKVEGYADRIGNAEVNHTLATARARAAAAVLGVETGMVSGSDQLLYDNATPEGRFYSRTVEVTITTPQTSPQ